MQYDANTFQPFKMYIELDIIFTNYFCKYLCNKYEHEHISMLSIIEPNDYERLKEAPTSNFRY